MTDRPISVGEAAASARTPRRRPTIALHVRLTVIFAAVFLIAGAVLLALNYTLLSARLPERIDVLTDPLISSAAVGSDSKMLLLSARTIPTQPLAISVDSLQAPGTPATPSTGEFGPAPTTTAKDLSPNADATGGARTVAEFANMMSAATVGAYRAEVLTQLLQKSILALVAVAAVATLVGLLLTRRLLRPVRDITRTARSLGEGSLDERLNVSGPHDDLRELGETFNAMLDRLAAAIGRERRIIASVSHELRSPLANQRIALEVGLADDAASSDELRALAKTVLGQNVRAQRLMESMLVLASAQDTPGGAGDAVIDLAEVVRKAAQTLAAQAELRGIRILLDVCAAPVAGDDMLLDGLVQNLMENAVKHNVVDGWVHAQTVASRQSRTVTLQVTNSGPVIPPDAVPQLMEPFRRQRGDRVRSDQGVGLGLAIVAAIVRRARGTLDINAREGGGLDVRVCLPVDREDGASPVGPLTTSRRAWWVSESGAAKLTHQDIRQPLA